jgi:phage N-6-adenine-methyltransferase
MANFSTAFKSSKQDWVTPSNLFQVLDDEFHFTLDVAASRDNAKCDKFFTVDDDGLKCDWGHEICWMNPPYNNKKKWVIKAYNASLNGATVVCLIPARTNTNWWHDYCMKGEVRFIRGRVKFDGAKHGLPQPLAFVIFSPPNLLTVT